MGEDFEFKTTSASAIQTEAQTFIEKIRKEPWAVSMDSLRKAVRQWFVGVNESQAWLQMLDLIESAPYVEEKDDDEVYIYYIGIENPATRRAFVNALSIQLQQHFEAIGDPITALGSMSPSTLQRKKQAFSADDYFQ